MSAYRFSTAERTLLPMERASVHFDGFFSEPRLQHPEGLAVGPGGSVWCGSENGEILKIAPDGSSIERIASTRRIHSRSRLPRTGRAVRVRP